MPDLKTTATELNSPECRYTYDALREICVYLAGKALSLERGNKYLRKEINNKKEHIAKLQRIELEKDKARLDWLADRDNVIGNVLLPREIVERNLGSLRDAIDEAMML